MEIDLDLQRSSVIVTEVSCHCVQILAPEAMPRVTLLYGRLSTPDKNRGQQTPNDWRTSWFQGGTNHLQFCPNSFI